MFDDMCFLKRAIFHVNTHEYALRHNSTPVVFCKADNLVPKCFEEKQQSHLETAYTKSSDNVIEWPRSYLVRWYSYV